MVDLDSRDQTPTVFQLDITVKLFLKFQVFYQPKATSPSQNCSLYETPFEKVPQV